MNRAYDHLYIKLTANGDTYLTCIQNKLQTYLRKLMLSFWKFHIHKGLIGTIITKQEKITELIIRVYTHVIQQKDNSRKVEVLHNKTGENISENNWRQGIFTTTSLWTSISNCPLGKINRVSSFRASDINYNRL